MITPTPGSRDTETQKDTSHENMQITQPHTRQQEIQSQTRGNKQLLKKSTQPKKPKSQFELIMWPTPLDKSPAESPCLLTSKNGRASRNKKINSGKENWQTKRMLKIKTESPPIQLLAE